MDLLIRPVPDREDRTDILINSCLVTPGQVLLTDYEEDSEAINEALQVLEEPSYSLPFYRNIVNLFDAEYAKEGQGEGVGKFVESFFETINSSLEFFGVPKSSSVINKLPERDTTYTKPDFSVLNGFIQRKRRRRDDTPPDPLPSKR